MRTTVGSNPPSDGQRLASLLVNLAQVLQSLGNGMSESNGSVETWSDGTSIYVDAKVPQLAMQRLDCCLHDGRIFVVLERS